MTVILLGLVVVAAICAAWVAYSAAEDRVNHAERRNQYLRDALEQVKTVAWDHRDDAPELSTQIMETIQRAERRNSTSG